MIDARMGHQELLATVEHLVMATALRMKDNAYGAEIWREITALTKRDILGSTIYSTLDRLEEKGYLKSSWGEATSVQGGRAKKVYTMTEIGLEVLGESRRALDAVWEGAGSRYPSGRTLLPGLKLRTVTRAPSVGKRSQDRARPEK